MPAAFKRGKTFAVVGLTLGFLLWQVGFMSIGGEWFGMWQSKEWNGVPSAFRFLITIIAVLIFVAMPDQELERRSPDERERNPTAMQLRMRLPCGALS